MSRYALILAYDGTHYHGWQKQPNAITIQEVIENRLSTVLNTPINVVGCGRTDTGVHATEYCAHFDALGLQDLPNLKYTLNKILPKDICIIEVLQVQYNFHARFDAVSREYKYFITLEKDIWNRDFAALVHGDLNVERMNKAAGLLVGKKDFTSFCKVGGDNENNMCEVFFSEVRQIENRIIYTIRANRFLRNMVRAIVGTLIEVGQGKIEPEDVLGILDLKHRSAAKKSADAKGLFLNKVEYKQM